MRAVGEVMSIGKTYKEAFQKAIRSLEKGRYGLGHVNGYDKMPLDELRKLLVDVSSERHFIMYEALRKGMTVDEIFDITKVKHYFIQEMKELVEEEEALVKEFKGRVPSDQALLQAKKDGFSDHYLAEILDVKQDDIRSAREAPRTGKASMSAEPRTAPTTIRPISARTRTRSTPISPRS